MDLEISEGVCSSGGAGEEALETTSGTEVPGGGAPLTIWSSLEPDISARRSNGNYCKVFFKVLPYPRRSLRWRSHSHSHPHSHSCSHVT